MSASNWTVCPDCVKRAKELRDSFVKKYYGKLDSFVYNKMINEVEAAVKHMESYSSDEYKPDEEIKNLMMDKAINVQVDDESYDSIEILQVGEASSCLREDYEQGVTEEGNVYFIYSCSCDCGFEKNVKYLEEKHDIRDKVGLEK